MILSKTETTNNITKSLETYFDTHFYNVSTCMYCTQPILKSVIVYKLLHKFLKSNLLMLTFPLQSTSPRIHSDGMSCLNKFAVILLVPHSKFEKKCTYLSNLVFLQFSPFKSENSEFIWCSTFSVHTICTFLTQRWSLMKLFSSSRFSKYKNFFLSTSATSK